MKKTYTINLSGKIFHIDEDALETGVRVFVQFVLDNMNGIKGMKMPEKG